MSDLKKLTVYAEPAFISALNELNIKNKSAFIAEAIAEKVKRDYDVALPIASAPHGVRLDALPDGWKSRMYPDRYQIVAVWDGNEFFFSHAHEFGKVSFERVYEVVMTDEVYPHDNRKVEVTIVDVPKTAMRDNVLHDLRLALHEWIVDHE